ncbi:hypothetical protein CXP40_14120 [Pseudomonas sp. YY-1]|nr:hypothetical protein CXP40_14120 [Pseudomonas sp. YY-1]
MILWLLSTVQVAPSLDREGFQHHLGRWAEKIARDSSTASPGFGSGARQLGDRVQAGVASR